jgi:hypothetical protein
VDERRGQVEPSAHATGVRHDGPVRSVGELEALEKLVGPLLEVGTRSMSETTDHDEGLVAGQALIDGGVLARQARYGSAPPGRA